MDRRSLLVALACLMTGGLRTTWAAALAIDDFAGTWRLALATDGSRKRTDLDEVLDLRVVAGSLEIGYRIADRFGSRDLALRAPLDGTPLVQEVQSRRAVVAARMVDDRLVLDIERDAPFGYVRNRRTMRLAEDRHHIEAFRENFKQSGAAHSSWQETWIRAE